MKKVKPNFDLILSEKEKIEIGNFKTIWPLFFKLLTTFSLKDEQVISKQKYRKSEFLCECFM